VNAEFENRILRFQFDLRGEITAKVPESAIVILSTHADERLIDEAKKIGARAYVAKTKAGEALVKATESAIAGGDFALMD